MFVVYHDYASGLNALIGQSFAATTGTWFQLEGDRNSGVTGDPYLAGFAADLNGGSTLSPNTSKIADTQYDGTTALLFKNGILVASSAESYNTVSSNFCIGAEGIDSQSSVNPAYLNGFISEVLVYASSLSQSDRQIVRAYLGNRYNIPLGQPQISTVDFTGITGLDFVTGGVGKFLNLYNTNNGLYIPWFNTGIETQPTVVGATGYIEVVISAADGALNLAAKTATAVGASVFAADSGGSNVCTITTTPVAGLYSSTTNISDGGTGATISTTQTGAGNS